METSTLLCALVSRAYYPIVTNLVNAAHASHSSSAMVTAALSASGNSHLQPHPAAATFRRSDIQVTFGYSARPSRGQSLDPDPQTLARGCHSPASYGKFLGRKPQHTLCAVCCRPPSCAEPACRIAVVDFCVYRYFSVTASLFLLHHLTPKHNFAVCVLPALFPYNQFAYRARATPLHTLHH